MVLGYSLVVQRGNGLLVVWPWAISINIFHGVLDLLFHARLDSSLPLVTFVFNCLYLSLLLCVCICWDPLYWLSFQGRFCVTAGLCTGCNLFGVRTLSCNPSCFFLIKIRWKKNLTFMKKNVQKYFWHFPLIYEYVRETVPLISEIDKVVYAISSFIQ